MENYICINGKKAELTEEQMKALGIELPETVNPFERADKNEEYYYINGYGQVKVDHEVNKIADSCYRAVANYCTDKSIMEQRALYETFLRLLWRYSMEHKAEKNTPCEIYYDCKLKEWSYYYVGGEYNYLCLRFDSDEIAKNAIEEIIKPFIAEHPDFVW